MSQTKLGSLVEVIVGTAIGMVISLIAQIPIFPLYGIEISMAEDIQIVILFTVVSIIRGYMVRRAFESWETLKDQFIVRLWGRVLAVVVAGGAKVTGAIHAWLGARG